MACKKNVCRNIHHFNKVDLSADLSADEKVGFFLAELAVNNKDTIYVSK